LRLSIRQQQGKLWLDDLVLGTGWVGEPDDTILHEFEG
jgi:hypothetical protein